MRLGEALRASKDEAATAAPQELEGSIITMLATKSGCLFITPDGTCELSWLDLQPKHQTWIREADWEPIHPKNPLVQLADALDDWFEDE